MYLHIINALTTKATSNIVQVRKKDYTDGRAVAAAGTAIVNGSRQAVLSPNEAPSPESVTLTHIMYWWVHSNQQDEISNSSPNQT